ncbi:unnamed protein product [Pleuronectes platessa]|uniref:Uncharacterized protein n=1 Tax=Pleuronectes platessa TaxID=8262 RepID=A0A9N7W0D9_PLEPL|nr:unnamed protein product [Pleuronectes platessa]
MEPVLLPPGGRRTALVFVFCPSQSSQPAEERLTVDMGLKVRGRSAPLLLLQEHVVSSAPHDSREMKTFMKTPGLDKAPLCHEAFSHESAAADGCRSVHEEEKQRAAPDSLRNWMKMMKSPDLQVPERGAEKFSSCSSRFQKEEQRSSPPSLSGREKLLSHVQAPDSNSRTRGTAALTDSPSIRTEPQDPEPPPELLSGDLIRWSQIPSVLQLGGREPRTSGRQQQLSVLRPPPFLLHQFIRPGMTQELQPPECQGNQRLNQSCRAQWEPHSQHMCTGVPRGPQICRTNEREYMCPTRTCPREPAAQGPSTLRGEEEEEEEEEE